MARTEQLTLRTHVYLIVSTFNETIFEETSQYFLVISSVICFMRRNILSRSVYKPEEKVYSDILKTDNPHTTHCTWFFDQIFNFEKNLI